MSRPASPRRHNAPIHPGKPPTVLPDFMFALSAAGWTMAAGFVIASFGDNNVTATEAGPGLARLFAAALAISGSFTFLLGYGLLRGERGHGDHYVVPIIVGAAIGAMETVLFLAAAGKLLLLPPLLLIFVLRPVRRHAGRLLWPTRGLPR